MRVVQWLLVLAALLSAVARAGQIAGVVVAAQGGEPVASVELTLSPVQSEQDREQRRGRGGPRGPGSSDGPAARTSLDGRFLFDGVEPGEYVLGASRSGFEGGGRIARRVVLDESAQTVGVRMELNRSPSIEGRVVDADGDPLPETDIQLQAWTTAEGRRALRPLRGARTDDRGEYRIYNLTPGHYLVYLQPASLGMMQGGLLYETAGVYYPRAATAAEGARLELKWGADVKGVDFVAPPAGRTLVSGTILQEDGTVCEACSLSILDETGLPVAATRVSDAGRFAVQGLRAADYTLAARAPRGGGLALAAIYLSEDRPVETSLRLVPSQSVSGAIVGGKTGNDEPVSFARSTLRLLPVDPTLAGQPLGARVQEDGSFEVERAPHGLYQAIVYNLPSNGYVERVLLGGAPLPGGQLPITGDGPVVGLRLEVAFDGGAVRGRATDADGNSPAPVGGAAILVPLNAAAAGAREQITGYTDEGFLIRGVQPGEYLLFSAPRNFAWDWSDVMGMADLKRRAARVEVRPGETVEAEAPFLEGP